MYKNIILQHVYYCFSFYIMNKLLAKTIEKTLRGNSTNVQLNVNRPAGETQEQYSAPVMIIELFSHFLYYIIFQNLLGVQIIVHILNFC